MTVPGVSFIYRNTEGTLLAGHCLSSLPCHGKKELFSKGLPQGSSLGTSCTSLGLLSGGCAAQGFAPCAHGGLFSDCAAYFLAKAECQTFLAHSGANFSQAVIFQSHYILLHRYLLRIHTSLSLRPFL